MNPTRDGSEQDSIHVTRWGSNGPVILMIHGGPQGGPSSGADQFSEQEQLASRGWQVIVPDRPGHGQTPSRGPEDMERDAVWVQEMLGSGAHLLGHSYGALIALAAAAQRPQTVRSLTLIEPPLVTIAPDDPAIRGLRHELGAVLTAEMSPLERLIAFGQIVGIPPGSAGGPMPSMEQLTAMGKAIHTMRPPEDWDGGEAAVETLRSAGIPVLVVTSGGVPGFEAIADAIVERTAGERVIIRTGNHFPHRSGQEFNDALVTFLTAAESRHAAVAPAE